MNKQKRLILPLLLLAAFILWTAAVCRIDVQPIGPLGSSVGFAAANRLIHNVTGVHMQLYTLTDWLGVVPIFVALGFAILGLVQWIKGRSIRKVDRSILLLGVFYGAVAAVYLFFERHVINYRPVLIEGVLEASYPSSTTLLVLSVMPTLVFQAEHRLKQPRVKEIVRVLAGCFSVFMVVGRLVAGVHWVTDILGAVFLSRGLFCLYKAAAVLYWKEK